MITREEFYISSADENHMIHGYRWYDPDVKTKGVLQLVHGMLEYVERYDEFARYMAAAGYFVIGHDHLGHGDSVKDISELGHVPEDAAVYWLKDIECVRRMAVSYAPRVPYVIMGHSMGSFLVRRYLIYCSDRVDGAIIMGTGHQPAALIKAGLALVYAKKAQKGGKGHSSMLNNLTCSGYAKKISGQCT